MRKGFRSVFAGVGMGVLLLLLTTAPFVWQYGERLQDRAVGQKYLVNAGGQGKLIFAERQLLVLPKVHEMAGRLSVSLGGYHWQAVKKEGNVLKYDPQLDHQIWVASGNQKALIPLDAKTMEEQKLEVDISHAPQAAQLMFLSGLEGCEEIRLQDRNVQSVSVVPENPGIKTHIIKDKLVFWFDKKLLNNKVFCFRLLFQNAHGEALTTVVVLPHQEKAYTPIRTAEELQSICRNPGGYYRLMNDISLEGVAWQPVGSGKIPFTGVFDGCGHAIRDFEFSSTNQEEEREDFSFLGCCEHAVIRNLRMISPRIDGLRSISDHFSAAALATSVSQCLVENCAVFGGRIITDKGSAAGLVVNVYDSVLTHLFNSANIEVVLPGSVMQNAGGIAANMAGHMSYCANEGKVAATHLTGGLFGFGSGVSVWRCVNLGQITGAVFIGEYPPGAFCQTIGGYFLSDCVFTRGSAGCAGSVFENGALSGIRVIEPHDAQDKAALAVLGAFEGENAQWVLGDPDAAGPLPSGVRSLKGYRPGGDQ